MANVIGQKERFTLDLIRGSAAQLVVFGHGISFVFDGTLWVKYLNYLSSFGVIIFIVISGYLIAASAERTRRNGKGFQSYFIARFARIFTAFIPCLCFIAILDSWLIHHYGSASYINISSLNLKTFFGNLFMFQTQPALNHMRIISVDQFGSGRPLWTVAFEWWLYMSFGMLFFLRKRLLKRKWFFLFLLVSLVPIINLIPPFYYASYLTLVWAVGATFWFTRKYWLGFSRQIWMIIFFCATSSFTFNYAGHILESNTLIPYAQQWVTHLTIMCISLIGWSSTVRNSSQPNHLHYKAAEFLTKYSFTLYLLHYSLQIALLQLRDDLSKPALLIIMIIFPNMISIGVAYLTEVHHRAVGSWLTSRLATRSN